MVVSRSNVMRTVGFMLVLLAAVVGVSGRASALDASGKVVMVRIYQNGETYIKLDSDVCTRLTSDGRSVATSMLLILPGTTFGSVSYTEKGRDLMVSVALAAQLSRKTVHIQYENGGPAGGVASLNCKLFSIAIAD
jgi:hypothetical protein